MNRRHAGAGAAASPGSRDLEFRDSLTAMDSRFRGNDVMY